MLCKRIANGQVKYPHTTAEDAVDFVGTIKMQL
jgi:hypothetical protein